MAETSIDSDIITNKCIFTKEFHLFVVAKHTSRHQSILSSSSSSLLWYFHPKAILCVFRCRVKIHKWGIFIKFKCFKASPQSSGWFVRMHSWSHYYHLPLSSKRLVFDVVWITEDDSRRDFSISCCSSCSALKCKRKH